MTTQTPDISTATPIPAPPPPSEAPFGVNAMRLSPRQWFAVLVILVACTWGIPQAWKQIEPLPTGSDDRVPYSLGEDYWLYQRRVEQVSDSASVAVLGDSVVWGHYVPSDQTLSAHLNRLTGGKRFVNLGVDGLHPAALMGLVDHFGQAIGAAEGSLALQSSLDELLAARPPRQENRG